MSDAATERATKAHDRWPGVLAVITALTGIAITLYSWARMTANEEATALQRFRLEAETLRLNTERELSLFMEVLDSILALHALSGEILPEVLEEFVEKGMVHQQQILGPFGFAQRISHSLREALERAYEESPELGYRIVQQGPNGAWQPAAVKPEYYPLTWQNRPNALRSPIGFDFSSRLAARYAIDRMHAGGQMALVLDPADPARAHEPVHWVFSPIFYRRADETPQPGGGVMIGFAVALLNSEEIMERVTAMFLPSPGLRLAMTPVTDAERVRETVERYRGEWRYKHPVNVIDTVWQFECRQPVTMTGRRSGAVLIAGLLITALMTSQLLIIAGRTRRIEDEVRARTEDLRQAKGQLEAQIQDRARLEEEMTDLASRERRKLGRDLHDSLGQKLTGAVFLSRSLLSYFRQSGAAQETHAKTLNETLKEAVGQVRAMAKGLAPITLSDEHLGQALTHLAEEMTDVYGVSCEVGELADAGGMDAKYKEQLYLIAREAANNAARHAEPGRVTIALEQDGDTVSLVVEDDGKGMPADAEERPGMGLRIMRHRARMIGAELFVEPGARGGTRVVCRVVPRG